MYTPVTIPFGAKMLFNTLKIKPGVEMEEVELALGEMCNVVKNAYGGDKGGFIAGQVFQFSGFVSDEGSLSATRKAEDHIAIVTYWRSFEEHERSHANEIFRQKFSALAEMCTDSKELGYDMLWQGEPEASEAVPAKTPGPAHA
jgi:heme-degrading monooxygenase HmoA